MFISCIIQVLKYPGIAGGQTDQARPLAVHGCAPGCAAHMPGLPPEHTVGAHHHHQPPPVTRPHHSTVQGDQHAGLQVQQGGHGAYAGCDQLG